MLATLTKLSMMLLTIITGFVICLGIYKGYSDNTRSLGTRPLGRVPYWIHWFAWHRRNKDQ